MAVEKHMNAKFPEWISRPWVSGDAVGAMRDMLRQLKLNTVCQSARCPNRGECWGRHTATVMILGDVCTRQCSYCAVHSGTPAAPDLEEPQRVAAAVDKLGLRHAVITSVTRDDLPDGGAAHFAATVQAIRHAAPGATVEVLTPDFQGSNRAVETVLEAAPDVFGHNVETVERLYPHVRSPQADYRRSLQVLRMAASHGSQPLVKSAFMVGHGETPEDVRNTLQDLLDAGCRAVCIGQYLQPTRRQRPVAEFVTPEQLQTYEALARVMGFAFAVAGPFVRSSYCADEALAHVSKGDTATLGTS